MIVGRRDHSKRFENPAQDIFEFSLNLPSRRGD
jgi:hypothetical protein